MAIHVICPGCHKRFQVSDEYGGRKGPCPACKTEIEIPKAEDQVVVHGDDISSSKSPEKMVLKPLERKETKVSTIQWVIIGGSVLLVLGLALMMRFSVENKADFPVGILVFGAIALGPPMAVAGYAFLREEELDPYTGAELWIRAGICGALYALLWGLYCWAPGWVHLEELETYQLAVLGSVIIGAGGFVALASFDFEYMIGLVHYGLYLLVCILLCLLMGYTNFMHAAQAG